MTSTRGVALASFAAPPFLTDKTSSPFKKVKQCLAQHRLEGGTFVSNGFLAIHKTSVFEVLEFALEAYERHRDDAVEKLNGKVSTVEYLKGKVRRKMEARIDWGDWSLLALALMMGQYADDASGMSNITPLWPAILHRLMHPWNTQAVRLTGFELMLVMCSTSKGFEVTRDVLVHSFKQAVQDDREDCAEMEQASLDPEKEFAERRPEVLEMEYPETSSAQGLAAAKAHITESSESSSQAASSQADSNEKPKSGGGMHLSVRLLRAASNHATFGIRSLYVGMAATEGGDHVPYSPFSQAVSGNIAGASNNTTSIPTRSNSILKVKHEEQIDLEADDAAHRSVHVLMRDLLPEIMFVLVEAKEMKLKGKGKDGVVAGASLLKLSESLLDLMRDVIGDMLGRPWIQDVVFRADYDKLIDDLFNMADHTIMMEHLVKKLDRITYVPYQLEMKWSSYCTRWSEIALGAFRAEANQPDNLSGRKSLQRATKFVQFTADRILSVCDSADRHQLETKLQHDKAAQSVPIVITNDAIPVDRISLSGPRFPSIHNPPPPPPPGIPGTMSSPPSTPITVTSSLPKQAPFGGGDGVPLYPVSFDSRELTQCWCALALRFLQVMDTTFAETKSSQFVLAMKDALEVVFSFGMRAVERGQWAVFHAVQRSLERWTTERGRCKVNSIGDSVMDCWGSLLVERSHTLVCVLDIDANIVLNAEIQKSTEVNAVVNDGSSLLSSGDEFDFSMDSSGASKPSPTSSNGTKASPVDHGLGAPVPSHPATDILSLIQLVPTFVSNSPVTDHALQVALVEAAAGFVRFWFNRASVNGASTKCRTRASFPNPKAYREYRIARETLDRSLVQSPSTSVAAATLLQLSASFLLPIVELKELICNRPAAIIVAKLLCDGLVLRHDKALHFPDELEDRIVKGLTRLLQVTMEEPPPSTTDRTTGRRMLDTIVSCLKISSYNSRRCAALTGPTLSLAAPWLSEGNIPPVVSERPEELLRLVVSAQGLVCRVNATPLVPGHINDRRLIAIYENLLNFVVNTAEIAIGSEHSQNPRKGQLSTSNNMSFSAGIGAIPPLPPPPPYSSSLSSTKSQTAESKSMLLATTATAATLIHLTQLGSVVLKSIVAAENARQSSVGSTASDGMISDALRKGEIARRSSMQSALETLDEAADMVLQCLDNISKQADINTVLISIRCLQDLAIAYPHLIQEHQVQSVWKTLCEVGNSNLSQLSRSPSNISMQSSPGPLKNQKVRAPPQPPVTAAIEDSYREMVCSVLTCLGRWLIIPHARLEPNDLVVESVIEFLSSCTVLTHPASKPGFPARNDVCHAARLMVDVITKHYRLQVFNFLASFPSPMEGWSLGEITAASSISATTASIEEQAFAMKRIKSVSPPPWGGVPWGNKSKGATQGRPVVCTGLSERDPVIYQCRLLGWWSGAPNLYQMRSSFGASSWMIAEHGVTLNDDLNTPLLYEWPLLGSESSRPSDLAKQLTFERQSTRRKKTLDFQSIPENKSKAPSTTGSFSRVNGISSNTAPKRRGSLVILESEEFSEEQSKELNEWSALPGAPQASPVHFDLFNDILDVFTGEVDTKDDPTFLGNAWGISLFEQAVSDADIAADLAYEKQLEEIDHHERAKRKESNTIEEKAEVKDTLMPEVAAKEAHVKKLAAATSPHITMLDSMNWILKDDAVMNDFQEKLEAEYAAESLIFYRAAREFHILALAEKSHIDRKREQGEGNEYDWTNSKSFEEAKSIYHRFIKVNSDQQINVPSIMVKNIRLALGIETALEKSKREKAEREAEEQGLVLDSPHLELDPEVFAPAIREVTVMLLKDKVPAYIANEKAPRRVKMISEIEKCHRLQATWGMDESSVANSFNTRRRLKEYVPDNSEDTSTVSSVKYFDPYYCASPPPLPTSMLASLGRFPSPPVPHPISITPSSETTPSPSTKFPASSNTSVLSVVECGTSETMTSGGGLHDMRSSYQEVCSNTLEDNLKAIDETPSKALIKIGVVYAKPRQYFQSDMLSNDTASVEFESFVRGIAHPEVIRDDGTGFQGFTGGITQSALADEVSYVPHFEDEVCEIALHVSTHIKTDGEQQINKTRHICNDAVTIVWSEDERDFLHSTFTSQLTAVTIVIYPHRKSLPDTRLYRIQLVTKEPLGMLVTCTGPLTDGAIVTADALPTLVRMTCVNAYFGLRQENKEELDNSQRRMACIERAIATANEPHPKAFNSVFAF